MSVSVIERAQTKPGTHEKRGLNGYKPEGIIVPTVPLRREDFKRDPDDPIHAVRKREAEQREAKAKAWAAANYGHNDRINERLLANLRAAALVERVVYKEQQPEKLPRPIPEGFIALFEQETRQGK